MLFCVCVCVCEMKGGSSIDILIYNFCKILYPDVFWSQTCIVFDLKIYCKDKIQDAFEHSVNTF